MNKQTKMYLGIGLVAVGAYLIYKQMTKAKPDTSDSSQTASFRGMRRMVGVNAEKGKFFDVRSGKF